MFVENAVAHFHSNGRGTTQAYMLKMKVGHFGHLVACHLDADAAVGISMASKYCRITFGTEVGKTIDDQFRIIGKLNDGTGIYLESVVFHNCDDAVQHISIALFNHTAALDLRKAFEGVNIP